MAVTRIDADLLYRFIESRRAEVARDATIRRNLGLLRAMLNRARKEGKLRLQDIPYFPMPKDSNPRKGFVDPDVFAQLLEALPENLRPLITFMYFTGCRLGAAQKITWAMVNRDATEIELPGEITKSGEPLTLPLVGWGLDQVSAMLRKMFRKEGPVFATTNLRKAWYRACVRLGLGAYDQHRRHYKGLTVHDLRRSTVRNLDRARVPRSVAMAITGHKTESVYERYNITSGANLREALTRVGEYNKGFAAGKQA